MNSICKILVSIIALLLPVIEVGAQQKTPTTPAAPLVTQKITREGRQRFEYGGTFTLLGAPQGSITIEGWERNEIAVLAEIELQAENEEDLKLLAQYNTFVLDYEPNHVRLLTTGTHDKAFMKRAKGFPKRLLGLPWKIDYRIRVPASTDLEVDAGRGPISLMGVEGALRIAATDSEVKLALTGGSVITTLGAGKVDLVVAVRSWRGSGIDIKVAAGYVVVEFPAGLNADVDADVLRNGNIEVGFTELQSRERPGLTAKQVKARAGAGGAVFKFTVGDGIIAFKQAASAP
jgi:hypothetical protein